MKTGKPSGPQWVLLCVFVYYVLSNAVALHEVLPVNVKHLMFVLLALLSAVSSPRYSAKAVLVSLPLALIYFIGGVPLLGGMVLVFAASVPVVSKVVAEIVAQRRLRIVLLLAAIALIPAMLSFNTLLDEGIFDTTYGGRERVLLGYFHPKEAGICFGIPALLLLMMLRRHLLIVAAVLAALIGVVGSRNVALLIIMAALLRRFPRAVFIATAIAGVGVLGWLWINPELLDALDTLMSLRLSLWQEALTASGDQTVGLNFAEGDRFGVDNFFVEAFIYAGGAAVALLLIWLAIGVGIVRRRMRISCWPMVALCLLLLFASFDSGIASTGNLMHAFLWSVMLAPIFVGRATRVRSVNKRDSNVLRNTNGPRANDSFPVGRFPTFAKQKGARGQPA